MEGAGDFSPLNKRGRHAGFRPGPEGQLTPGLDFVGLKPHAPSANAE
jgi:hypothetical protein